MPNCACGSGQSFLTCCGQYIEGEALPATAEALMRSRYTAYTLGRVDYIQQTMSGKASEGFDPGSAKTWSQSLTWEKLNVINTGPDLRDQDQAFVEFCALFHDQGQSPRMLHERSKFKQIEGRWFYVDGSSVAVGRNDPCPCGSGGKFKKCCSNRTQ